MAKYTIEDTTLTNIANAIREKGGTTESLTPTQMPEAIGAIEAGSGEPGKGTILVRPGTGYKPKTVNKYGTSGSVYYSTTSSAYVRQYYWYREDNTNIYWNVATWDNGLFTPGRQYRMTFWIWHDASASNDPVPFHQSNIFINASVSVENPIKEITPEPQLVTFTITYVSDGTYGFGLWLYPVASGNQIRLTPAIIEDLTLPSTNPPVAY